MTMSPRSERLSMSLSSGKSSARSITLGCSICRREKASNWRVRLPPRSVALVIVSRRCVSVSPVMCRRSRCTVPLTIMSRLLKSCATPPVSWPMASRRCAWRSASSAISRRSASSCSRSVRLSAIHSTPNDKQCGGQPEHQIRAHRRKPFSPDLAGFGAGERINRKAFELAEAHAARNMVDLGIDGEQAAFLAFADR